MDSDSGQEIHDALDVTCDLFDDSDQMKTISLRENNIHALDTSVLNNNFSVKSAYRVPENITKNANGITQDSGKMQFTQFNKELREAALIKKERFIRSQDHIPGNSEEWPEYSYEEELMNSDEQSSVDESTQGLPSKRYKFSSTDDVFIASSTSDIFKMTENVHGLRSTPAKNHFGSINSEIPLSVSSSNFPIQVSPKPWSDDLDILSETAQTHLSQINLKNDGADFFDAYHVNRHLKLSENKHSCNENEPKDPSPNNSATSLPFVCPFCNLSETDIRFLEEHIEALHPVNMSGELGGTGAGHNARYEGAKAMSYVEDAVFLYVCPLCDMDLGEETSLHLHLNTSHEVESQIREASTINCPLCEVGCLSEQEMKIHVKNHGTDDTKYFVSTNDMEIESGTYTMMCPVCNLEMDDADLLTSHVESHFNPQHSAGTSLSYREINNAQKHVTGSSVNGKQKKDTSVSSTSIDIATSSKVKQFKSDTKESCSSNAIDLNKKTVWPSQWNQSVTSRSSDERFMKTSSKGNLPSSSNRENGSYKKQYEQSLERAVVRGEISAAEFHEEMRKLSHQVVKGVDDGSTRIQGLIEKMEAMYRSQVRPGQSVLLCSATDHFSGSLGDKGWGCGYRNFQMILSCLAKLDNYALRIFKDEQRLIPSIPKIQQMIELAWQQGFDPQGCSQLNGRLCNTRKWIGATEIVAVLSSLGIKCQLVDFHSPSAPDGTHPHLLEWVKEYFKKFHYQPTAPLYLQHQGHSRIIVGVENDKGTVKLLLFDPGTRKDQIAAQVKGQMSWKDMRLFRRTQAGFKARQYQIVAIVGILTEQEYQESKILNSERIS